MQNQLFSRYLSLVSVQSPNRLLFRSMVVGVATVSALCASTSLVSAAFAGQVPSFQQQAKPNLTAAASATGAGLPDGTYLYGQSSKPDQVGKGYFVFEVNQRRVVGALYMPRSSFDCASGSFAGNQLALTVVNSYDRTTNPFDIALEGSSNVASNSPSGNLIGLQGFHRISNVSQNDYRILNTCKADLKKQAQK